MSCLSQRSDDSPYLFWWIGKVVSIKLVYGLNAHPPVCGQGEVDFGQSALGHFYFKNYWLPHPFVFPLTDPCRAQTQHLL